MADVVVSDAASDELMGLVRWKFDVDAYHRMGVAGILSEDDRVELIEGELIEMSAVGTPHFAAVNRLNRMFVRLVGDSAAVSVQNPVRLTPRTEPQPDIVLLKPRDDDYASQIPGPEHVLLLVEVSDSSLAYDRLKLRLYARNGIPEVWVVDVEAARVWTHRDPQGDGYAVVGAVGREATLTPSLLPDIDAPMSDILK